jgi:hypothetical protein
MIRPSAFRTIRGSPMADIEWKPLPEGLWTPPAVFADAGNRCLQAFTDDGVPTWEICKKKGKRGEWDVIAKGTADSFEAAKAAALFEAEAASRVPWYLAVFVNRPLRAVGRDGRALFEAQRTLRETDAQSSGSDARIRDFAVLEPTRRGLHYVLIAHSSAAFRASSTASFFLMSEISLRIACNSLWDFLLTRYSEPSCATMYRSS